MLKCPKCGSTRFFRTQLRWWERPSRLVNGGRPYRCQDCLWREWLPWQAAAAGAGTRRNAARQGAEPAEAASQEATSPVAASSVTARPMVASPAPTGSMAASPSAAAPVSAGHKPGETGP